LPGLANCFRGSGKINPAAFSASTAARPLSKGGAAPILNGGPPARKPKSKSEAGKRKIAGFLDDHPNFLIRPAKYLPFMPGLDRIG
jgi:hypothetical protein